MKKWHSDLMACLSKSAVLTEFMSRFINLNWFNWKMISNWLTFAKGKLLCKRIYPEYANAYFEKLLSDKRFRELEIQLKPYLKSRDLNTYHALTVQASAYIQVENYRDALKYSLKAITLHNDDFFPNYIAGVSLYKLGRPADALEFLEKGFTLDPNNVYLNNALFQSLFDLGKVDYLAEIYSCTFSKQPPELYKAKSIERWVASKNGKYVKVLSAEVISYVEPTVIGYSDRSKKIDSSGNDPYWAELYDVKILGSCSFILTSDKFLLSDDAANSKFRDFINYEGQKPVIAHKNDLFLIDVEGYNVKQIEIGIWLSGYASDAFGHWLPDFLTKLQFFMEHPNYESIPIIVDAEMPRVHMDLLSLITKNEIIKISRNEMFRVSTLVVAPSPCFYPVLLKPNDLPIHGYNSLSPRGLNFVRGLATKGLQRIDSQKRRIYISRKNTSYRKLANEDDVFEEIKRYGFEIVFPEQMSVMEQINLFQSAEWIVSPHGSALINVIYCEPGVKILILSQSNVFNFGNYLGPVRALGYHPELLTSKSDHSNFKHEDFRIEPSEVAKALEFMGIS
jgi:tetratricopeptide (TPR) repeat protein